MSILKIGMNYDLFIFWVARWRNSWRRPNLFCAWENWKLFLFLNLCAWVVKLVDKLLEHLRLHLKSIFVFLHALVISRIRLFMAVTNERKFSSLKTNTGSWLGVRKEKLCLACWECCVWKKNAKYCFDSNDAVSQFLANFSTYK